MVLFSFTLSPLRCAACHVRTGRRPDRTRTYDLFSYFRTVAANYTTIPQWFKQHGYTSIGMGKIFHPVGQTAM
jgi:arylsulfatase A-like enzyme